MPPQRCLMDHCYTGEAGTSVHQAEKRLYVVLLLGWPEGQTEKTSTFWPSAQKVQGLPNARSDTKYKLKRLPAAVFSFESSGMLM